MATKTGCSTVAGSHQPRSSAAVRQVKTADGGKINRHATSSAASIGESTRGAYSPRDTRRQRRDRVVPRNGIDSASTADVTPGRCVRLRDLVRGRMGLWTARGAPAVLWIESAGVSQHRSIKKSAWASTYMSSS